MTTPTVPELGDFVSVMLANDDAVLINTDTRAPFVPGVPTQQVMDATTLRRLEDGDLVLVMDAPAS